jgi:hypothetical protein
MEGPKVIRGVLLLLLYSVVILYSVVGVLREEDVVVARGRMGLTMSKWQV